MGALRADAADAPPSTPVASWYCGCCGLVRPAVASASARPGTPPDAASDASR